MLQIELGNQFERIFVKMKVKLAVNRLIYESANSISFENRTSFVQP